MVTLCRCGCGLPALLPYARVLAGGWWRDDCLHALAVDAEAIHRMTPSERAVLRSVFEVAGLPALAWACGEAPLPFEVEK